jgi:hypothetical protein
VESIVFTNVSQGGHDEEYTSHRPWKGACHGIAASLSPRENDNDWDSGAGGEDLSDVGPRDLAGRWATMEQVVREVIPRGLKEDETIIEGAVSRHVFQI